MCPNAIFLLLTEKLEKPILSDDANRSRMHVNTPIENNGSQKNRIRRSDVFRIHIVKCFRVHIVKKAIVNSRQAVVISSQAVEIC